MDLRPGGTWRFVQQDADGKEYAFHGAYREVVPPARVGVVGRAKCAVFCRACRAASNTSVVSLASACRPRCTLAYEPRIAADMASITASGFTADLSGAAPDATYKLAYLAMLNPQQAAQLR